MKRGIADKVIKPGDCALAFGIPLSKEAFDRAVSRAKANPRSPESFVSQFLKKSSSGEEAWDRYERNVVSVFEELRPELKALGADIFTDVTLDGLGEIFASEKHSVITLFTHKDEGFEDLIEFSGGFADAEEVTGKIPHGYKGFVDLSVCHSTRLTAAIRQERPGCLICFSGGKISPALWLYIYLAIYSRLKSEKLTYLKALDDVIAEFSKDE